MMYISISAQIRRTFVLLLIFLFGGLIFLCIPVSAQTATSINVNTSASTATFSIPDGYFAIAFKWQSGTTFQYSFDGINFSYPTVGVDETEKMADGHNYSAIVVVPGSRKQLSFRNSNAGVVTVNLIPGLSTPGNSLLYTGNASVALNQVNLNSGANYSELPIISRALWGANESYMNWPPEYWQNTRIIVHHTVTDSSTGDYPAVVRSIYYYHAVTLGWGDIGYNYIIDPNGNIYEGRTGGEGAIGAHAYANNAGAIGISFIGDFTYKLPTAAALQAFKNLAAERAIINNFALTWGTTVTGHRDQPQNNTSCPGTGLYNSLQTITIEAEAVRQTLIGGTIDLARQNMETTLAGYPDIRLKLTFTNSGLTDAEKLALIPKYSGIKSISSVVANTVTIEVESWSDYYGYWKDDAYDRVKMLYLIFSLDPNFSGIELLTDFAFTGTYPANAGKVLVGDTPYLLFSRTAVPGTGNIEIRKITDNSLVDALDVNSAAVSFADRRVYLLPHVQLDPGITYYVTVCNTCIQSESAQVFPGFSGSSAFSFYLAVPLPTKGEYNGDTKSDLAVYRFSTMTRFVLDSAGVVKQDTFGAPGDMPVFNADYDGDKIVDLVVFRPSNATWYIFQSQKGFKQVTFGDKTDTPINAGDFDGDGLTDIAVFRSGTATRYVWRSRDGFKAYQFGALDDVPVHAGYYDEDNKTDLAVYRPSNQTWYLKLSRDGFKEFPIVVSSNAVPINAGDFDGDGKTDIAMYAGITRYVWQSVWGYRQISFGLASDIPVHGEDFDGDHLSDIAVFRPSEGKWHISYSGGGTWERIFGSTTDSPVQ